MNTTKHLATLDVTQLVDVHGGKKKEKKEPGAASAPSGMTQFGFTDVKQGFQFSLTRS